MSVQAVKPEIDTVGLLPGAQFADAYCVAVDGVTLDARHAAEKMLSRGPRWIDALLALRNHLVKPFGLKTPPPNANANCGQKRSERPGRVPCSST